MAKLEMLQGTLDLLVLRALSFGPRHGYAVARFIRAASGETFTILDGALYASLHRLEGRKTVSSTWGVSDKGKRAKFYELTPRGELELKGQAAAWARYAKAIDGVLTSVPQGA